MRVLAIRGENLTSLAGRFEVDLTSEPLSGSGLFAITGVVGAGKSTLLDALCLALFDRTPRLADRGGAMIGDASDPTRISALDVRGILRRGAGSGWAEADFAGRSGRAMRARWSVRRARGRADGRFQPQTMTLEEIESGRSLGGTKRETLNAIEAEIGLTFEQFRRSVVLAQGEFATFLRAKPGDRAALLERMTDTAIYGELSISAHRRASDARSAIAVIEQQLAEVVVLDREARLDLERRLEVAERRFESVERAVQASDDVKRVENERGAIRDRIDELSAAAGSARTLEADRRAEVDAARESIERHDAEIASRAEELAAARELDVQVSRASADLAASELATRSADALVEAARAALKRRASNVELPTEWNEFRRELGRLVTISEQLREAESRCESCHLARERAAQALLTAVAKLDSLREELEQVERQDRDCERESHLVAMARVREGLEAELDAARLVSWTAEREAQRRELELGIAEAERVVVESRSSSKELERSAAKLECEIASARTKLDRHRNRVDLEEQRAHLVEGEPCPLCGSRSHPLKLEDVESVNDDDLNRWISSLESDLVAATAARAVASERERSAEERVGPLRQRLIAATAELESRAAEAAAARERVLERSDIAAGAGPDEVDAVVRSIDADLRRAREAERGERDRFEELQRAQAEFTRRQQAFSDARSEVMDGERDLRERDRQLASFETSRDELRAREIDAREAIEEMLDSRLEQCAALREQVDQQRERCAVLQRRRSETLDGISVEKFEARSRELRAAAERALDSARDRHAAAASALAAVDTELAGARRRATELDALFAELAQAMRVAFERVDPESTGVTREAIGTLRRTALQARDSLSMERGVDDRAIVRRHELTASLAASRSAARPRLDLAELIGSADGRKFREFAQSISFEHLVVHANRHLADLTPRYRLMPVPGQHLDLQMVDCEMGGERRSIHSLSGGEGFIVSLALALGLASMAARHVPFETLFIDEGLGTLDPDSLESVLAALDALQSTGYQVGIISHVDGLAERVGARVDVVKLGGGRSEVRVGGGNGATWSGVDPMRSFEQQDGAG